MLSRTTFSPLSALYKFSPTSPLSDLTQPLFTFKVVQHPPLQWSNTSAPLFERYLGLRLLTMDALYAERDLCQAIVDHGRDYLARVKGESADGVGGVNRRFCRGGTWGAAGGDPGESRCD